MLNGKGVGTDMDFLDQKPEYLLPFGDIERCGRLGHVRQKAFNVLGQLKILALIQGSGLQGLNLRLQGDLSFP